MKKPRKRALAAILVALGLILGLAGYLVASTLGSGEFVTELPFEKPESLVFHERLAEYVTQGAGTSSDTVDPELERAAQSLAHWQAVIDLMEVRLQDTDTYYALDELVWEEMEEWDDADWRLVGDVIAENGDLIEQTRQAAQFGGPIQLVSVPPNMTLWVRNSPLLRKLVALIRLRVSFHAIHGDQSAAVSDALLGMEVAELLAAEPSMISHLLHHSFFDHVMSALSDAFPPGEMDSRELNRLLKHEASVPDREAFADCFRASTYSTLHDRRAFSGQTTRSATPLQGTYREWKARKLQADCLAVNIRLEQVANRPFYEGAQRLAEVTGAPSTPIDRFLSSVDSNYTGEQLWKDVGAGRFWRQARHEASIDLVQMGLLIEQHYAEHGSYPDSLDVLAPALGGTVPLDPFSGEPYRYVVTDDGFLLYSVGRNQVDDGGVHDHVNFEWVWRGERE